MKRINSELQVDNVNKFLKDLSEKEAAIVNAVRMCLLDDSNGMKEELKWGSLVFSKEDEVCSLQIENNNVILNFFEGARINDTYGLLEGTTNKIRYYKLNSPSDVNEEAIRSYLKQAIQMPWR